MKLFLIIILTVHTIHGELYPQCWVQNGECLDSNQGPLTLGIKPLINENVLGNATYDVTSLDDCMVLCLENSACRYFTWYPMVTWPRNESSCALVGYNLQQACFNLDNVCVLMKECLEFDTTCETCQTGKRPFMDPREEPLTTIMTGMTDNRFYRQQLTRQYSLTKANTNELLINLDVNKTCAFRNSGLTPRMGAVAGFVNGTMMVCGGYYFDDSTPDDSSMALGSYLADCQQFTSKSDPWVPSANLTKARAFASGVVAQDHEGNDVFYVLGGYERSLQFLTSVEEFKGTTWSENTDMELPIGKSHFCTVFLKDQFQVRHLYSVGGWNIEYLSDFRRLTFDNSSDTPLNSGNGAWEKLADMPTQRGDHACAFLQFKWSLGIMVAGGYGNGAWIKTVDFFDFNLGKWTTIVPALSHGRHYNGLATVGLIPMIFGGWNNGSLNSYDRLNFCTDPPTWQPTDNFFLVKREKFAFASVPRSYVDNCG